jgi:hypothetical protein
MLRPIAALCAAALITAMPAAAQDSRYSSNWGTPPSRATAQSGGESSAQRLVDELDRLVDQAEKARAADPVFLRDLRDLARRYDWPWSTRVLADDWSDGNATASPAWQITGAPISVDGRYGLRTLVERAATPAAAPGSGNQAKPGDVALQIFGQILRQQSQASGNAQQPAAAAPAATTTELVTTVALSNAFALELDLYANARPASGDEGLIEVGVGQGASGYGYRLSATFGAAGGTTLALLRVGASGITVAERAASAIDLADGATHRLQLTRDRAGGMRLLVDGSVVSQIGDRAFTDGFDRVVIVNRGGDYTLRAVAAYGVN